MYTQTASRFVLLLKIVKHSQCSQNMLSPTQRSETKPVAVNSSTPSGRPGDGFSPPLNQPWPSTSNVGAHSSRSCSPSNKFAPSKSSVGSSTSSKSHELETETIGTHEESGIEINNASIERITSTSFSASSSTKSYPKFSHHPSNSSIISNGSEKRKRKSWVKNALTSTYKSRCEDLLRNFPGLPPDETLIVDYSCALQKDILVHGRLYITTNFLCFYANIFRWETAVTIRWREVNFLL